MSNLPSTLFGESQTLRYGSGADLITVVLDSDNFKIGSGEGLLTQLGYDRVDVPDTRRRLGRSTMGTPVIVGPSFAPVQQFEWRLQLLTDSQWRSLKTMDRRQQVELRPIRLLDQRVAWIDSGQRRRAKIGALLPAEPGAIVYWAQFDLWLEELSPINLHPGKIEVSCKAIEAAIVPTTEDL